MAQLFKSDLLSGKVALITGGGTGLGFATAHQYVKLGAKVVLVGRRSEPLADAQDKLGLAATWHQADIREAEGAQAAVQAALDTHGRLDLLVNNAGGQYFVPAELIEAKGWHAVWRLNVGATDRMCRFAHQLWMAERGGTIINITLSPHHGLPGMAHSSSARAAVEALTGELATQWGSSNITVCAVAAGHFATDALNKYPEPVKRGVAQTVPLGRLGEPVEHAQLMALLASPLGAALSGQTITLDGARDNWFGPWPPTSLTDASGDVPTEARKQ